MATIDDLFEPERPFSDAQLNQILADPIEELYPWGPAPAELSGPGPLEAAPSPPAPAGPAPAGPPGPKPVTARALERELAPAPARTPSLEPARSPMLLVEEVPISRPGKWVALAMLAVLLGLGALAWVRAQPPDVAPVFIPAAPGSK